MIMIVVEVVVTTTTTEAECFPETTVPTDLAAWHSNSHLSLIGHKYWQLLGNVTLLILLSWRQIIVFLDNAAPIINLLLQHIIIFNSSYLCITQTRPNVKCLFLMFHILEAVGLTFWHQSFTFNSNKSPTWCNNFSIYYPDVCLQLNMFRAFSRSMTAVIELLMMGGERPETRWAVNKRQDNKLINCCIRLVIYLNCTMTHGLTNLKFYI